MNYEKSKQALLADLKSIPDTVDINMYWDAKGYSPSALAKEVEDETEHGRQLILVHMQTITRIKKILENESVEKPRKKRWQFWK